MPIFVLCVMLGLAAMIWAARRVGVEDEDDGTVQPLADAIRFQDKSNENALVKYAQSLEAENKRLRNEQFLSRPEREAQFINKLESEIASLRAENARLQMELKLAQPLYSRRELIAENERLRAELQRARDANEEINTAFERLEAELKTDRAREGAK